MNKFLAEINEAYVKRLARSVVVDVFQWLSDRELRDYEGYFLRLLDMYWAQRYGDDK